MPESAYGKFRNALVETAIKVAPDRLAHFNNARLGFPPRVFHGAGGIGDDLLCTTVFRELKKRGEPRIVIRSHYAELFQGNPDVDVVIRKKLPIVAPLMIHGLNFLQLRYPNHPEPITEHIIVTMCRMAGISGDVLLRPYIFLSAAEPLLTATTS